MTTEILDAPTGTPDAAATTQVEAQQVEQKEPVATPATSEKPAEPEAEKPKEPRKPEAWVQKRIDTLTARNKAYEAELARYRQAEPAADTNGEQKPADVHALAQQIASSQRAQERFEVACNTVYDAGVKEYKADFDTAIGTLQNVLGEDYPAMLGAVLDSGSVSPGVLMHFAQNPEDATRFTDLSPRAQGRELARIEAGLEAKRTAKPTSAPPPVSSVGASGSANKSIDDMSMAEYMEHRKKSRK